MDTSIRKFLFGSLGVAAILGAILIAVIIRNQAKAFNYIGRTGEQQHTLYVNGEGKVTAVPDIAKIQLGLTSKSKEVAAAQKENTEKMNGIISALKNEFKIKTEDIKTQNYSIYPEYDWMDNRQSLKGYVVSQNLEVKIRELEKISSILQKAGEQGLNQVGGLTFDIDEKDGLKAEAREKAVKNAREKAESIAEAAGVKLGGLVSFTESDGYNPPIYKEYYMAEGLGGGGASPEIESGTNEIVVSVSLVFEIL